MTVTRLNEAHVLQDLFNNLTLLHFAMRRSPPKHTSSSPSPSRLNSTYPSSSSYYSRTPPSTTEDLEAELERKHNILLHGPRNTTRGYDLESDEKKNHAILEYATKKQTENDLLRKENDTLKMEMEELLLEKQKLTEFLQKSESKFNVTVDFDLTRKI